MVNLKQRGSGEVVILVVVLALIAGLVAWRIADTMKTQQDTEASVNSSEQTPTGSNPESRVAAVLTFPDFKVSLKVEDADFEPGDLGFSKVDDYYMLNSKTLRENKNEACSEDDGRFASVTGTDEATNEVTGQEGKKIGDFYYYVSPINLIECYPSTYDDKYMTPAALDKLKNALVATSEL